MKYVYVLTSIEEDYYYEQFLLSIFSFRLFNKDAEVILLIDENTKQTLIDKRTQYEKYISRVIIVNVPNNYSQKEASRWIKTSIHHYVEGEFLYIDCDTIITEKIESEFFNDIKIGAILDTHVTLEKHHLRNNFRLEDLNAGFSSSLKTNIRYNGGIVYCSGDSYSTKFFEKWHFLWQNGLKRKCSQDMPSFNQANFEEDNIITELSGEWNCQIGYNMLPFLHNAKIIHYFATSLYIQTSPYILASFEILNKIKDTGTISNEIFNIVNNAKTAFVPESQVIAGKEILDIINSSIFLNIFWLRKKLPYIFNFFDKINFILRNPKNIFIKCNSNESRELNDNTL